MPGPVVHLRTLRAIHACEPGGGSWCSYWGGDMFLDIPSWREPGEIIALAALAAAHVRARTWYRGLEHMAHLSAGHVWRRG